MKIIIRLLVFALLLNVGVHVGAAFWRYYAFKDDVEQAVRYGGADTAPILHQRILQLAAEHGIEIYPADVVVHKERAQTTVSALYGEEIELLPRMYKREHLFEFEVTVEPSDPTRPDLK